MQTTYTIYFIRNSAEVVPLRFCNSYSHAEELMESVLADFVKLNYTGYPYKLYRQEEGTVFSNVLHADKAFTNGIVFAKKRHEAEVYEKICNSGYVVTTHTVKFLGRIGVLIQQQELPATTMQLIESLRSQIAGKNSIIAREEQMIQRYESELNQLQNTVSFLRTKLENREAKIDRLEITVHDLEDRISEIDEEKHGLLKRNEELEQLVHVADVANETGEVFTIPNPPRRPNEITIRKESIRPVLDELKAKFANNEKILKKHKKSTITDADIDDLIADIEGLTKIKTD